MKTLISLVLLVMSFSVNANCIQNYINEWELKIGTKPSLEMVRGWDQLCEAAPIDLDYILENVNNGRITPYLELTNVGDNFIIEEILVNRGVCELPKDILNAYVDTEIGFSSKARLYYGLCGELYEISIKTNLGLIEQKFR